ncbi:MAG TPA: LacI family DNA-binding transcriptional regulator [Actinocatenispora sp.]
MVRRLAVVAEKVGVSEATVSRVLNGKPGVAQATRDAVLTALDVLGYERPTQLRGERLRLVGLMLPELQNPIFPAFADVVGDLLAQRGFTPVLCTRTANSGGVSEAEYIELLLGQHVSGVLFAGGTYAMAGGAHGHYADLVDRNLPAVLLNAAIDDLPFPRVSADDAVAAEQALGHLVSLGHERIGLLLAPPDHVPSRRKQAAFEAMAERLGIGGSVRVTHGLFSLESGQAAAARLIDDGITGIVCASDLLALGAVRAARRAGRRVPGDVSVIGYDDSALMTCVDPPLTTVRQPIEAMGRTAVDLLVNQINGAHVPTDELLYETELVVRSSTGPAR